MNEKNKLIVMLLCVSLMVASICIVHIFRIPNPMLTLMIPVVYCVYSYGYIGGILSGVSVIIYSSYLFLVISNDPASIYKVINIGLVVSAVVLIVRKLKAQDKKNLMELKQLNDALLNMAITDNLTGASNRHAFFGMANSIYENSCQLGTPLSVLFIDIDDFKQVNDTYGHAFGDVVLARLSEIVNQCLGSSDINCRYGGEEFVVLLAHTACDSAQIVAERIMEKVHQIRFEECPDFRFTISIGVSGMIPSLPQGIKDLIDSADRAMYQAKQAGGNCVVQGKIKQKFDGYKPYPTHTTVVDFHGYKDAYFEVSEKRRLIYGRYTTGYVRPNIRTDIYRRH